MSKPLIEQYNLMEVSGTKYALKKGQETELKSRLSSYKAKELFEMLKERQQEQFYRMIREGVLVSFLNSLSNQYLRKVQQHIDNGMSEVEAAEIEWSVLMEQAGLK